MRSLGTPNGSSFMAGSEMSAPVIPVMAIIPWSSPRPYRSRIFAFESFGHDGGRRVPSSDREPRAVFGQLGQLLAAHIGLERRDDRSLSRR